MRPSALVDRMAGLRITGLSPVIFVGEERELEMRGPAPAPERVSIGNGSAWNEPQVPRTLPDGGWSVSLSYTFSAGATALHLKLHEPDRDRSCRIADLTSHPGGVARLACTWESFLDDTGQARILLMDRPDRNAARKWLALRHPSSSKQTGIHCFAPPDLLHLIRTEAGEAATLAGLHPLDPVDPLDSIRLVVPRITDGRIVLVLGRAWINGPHAADRMYRALSVIARQCQILGAALLVVDWVGLPPAMQATVRAAAADQGFEMLAAEGGQVIPAEGSLRYAISNRHRRLPTSLVGGSP